MGAISIASTVTSASTAVFRETFAEIFCFGALCGMLKSNATRQRCIRQQWLLLGFVRRGSSLGLPGSL
jgi:hypothetical protein